MSLQDNYVAKLWQYNLEKPELGMRDRESLEKLFFNKEFTFTKGSYQAGELCYMAKFSELLLQGFVNARAEEDKKLREEGREERNEEEQEKEKQREELFNVTQNRRRLILQDLSSWFERLETIHYFRSKATDQPYIDPKGRVYIFTDIAAIEKAKKDLQKDHDVAVDEMDLQDFCDVIYRNGCKLLVMNNNTLAFSALREDLLPKCTEEQKADEDRITEHNRALRFALLIFLQILKNPELQAEDKEKERGMVLQQAEAQISSLLLQAKLLFKSGEEDGKKSFVLYGNGDVRAIAAYTDLHAAAEEDKDTLVELPVFPVAQQIVADDTDVVQGILLNAGELNFLLDKNWLVRLTKFAEFIMEQQKAAEDQNQSPKAEEEK